jgi:hypothetical protein
MSVYRPTVRYAPAFRDYVDSVFQATTLDRNQIIRAALFAAAHTKEFYDILIDYKKEDVPLPCPKWRLSDHHYWLEQCPVIEKGGKDVNANSTRRTEFQNVPRNDETRSVLLSDVSSAVSSAKNGRIQSIERRDGKISTEQLQSDGRIRIREAGGITIRLG